MSSRYYLLDDAAHPAPERPARSASLLDKPGPRRMLQIGFGAPGHIQTFESEESPLPDGAVRLETLYSGIFEDEELASFFGTNPALHARWDDARRLYVQDGPRTAVYPLPLTGCMEVARVAETRTDVAREGEIVGLACGHRTVHTADPRCEPLYLLGEEVEPILGIFAAHVGPLCAAGLLHADAEAFGESAQVFGVGVRGRCVLVCGTGVVALLTALMCRWAGAAEIVVAGYEPRKLEVAARLGLRDLNVWQVDAGAWAKDRWHEGGRDCGAHMAFQCSGSDELLNHAVRALQPGCPIFDVGTYPRGAESVPLAPEFHRNGLRRIAVAEPQPPRRLRDCWDRRRLVAETLAFLRAEGPRVREHLVTHAFPFERAQDAFDLLAYEGKQALQVVLSCA